MTLDAGTVRRHVVSFLRSYLEGAGGAKGFVLGMSGGIDSAVVGALAAEAVGADRVLALLLPHATSAPTDEAHATLVCEHLRIPHERVDITPIVAAAEAACASHPLGEGMARANLRPRARMMVLYAHAAATERLVLGTGNKSELLTGYFTKWGDGAADVYPLGDLYKTDVFALARELRLPREVVDKAPSAGLYAGQTDEDELGIRYAELDKVLAELEAGHDAPTAARRAGVTEAQAGAVEQRVISSAHKRNPLVIPKMGFRTPGWDWREPRQRGSS